MASGGLGCGRNFVTLAKALTPQGSSRYMSTKHPLVIAHIWLSQNFTNTRPPYPPRRHCCCLPGIILGG